MFTRRDILGGMAAAPLFGRAVHARSLGTGTLTTVSDGNLVLPALPILDTMTEADAAAFLDRYGLERDRATPPCNLALYQDGTNTVLFDAGSGPAFMPSAGMIVDSLDAAGVAPEDITHVVFTHAHPDHIWGLIDDFDEPLFYNATHMMGRTEWDFWWDPATADTLSEDRVFFAVGAKRRMEFIEDSVVLFDDGAEILPGIAAVATHGHTPGHMSFEIRSGGDSAMVVGDAIVNHHVALAMPAAPGGSDQDPDMAAATRLRLIDRLVSEDMALVGFHLPDGGMGRITPDGDGFRFVPEAG
ncbi:MBL fold metallo-hydrolase [Ovoidimarina sediminis]|uniref:MBL fold metallo-hydrolase n=1 Tax=Ovoidimarina sediminis TaxID=3079856 RepID=UPI002910CDFF|nr:MBL fold metallo-hydrolase [Rhodophyticola sp. MJ-SS7]MDU8942676.1 MBL fold metallo-hydrolase [Rhodophyticola sp. MJ-SS7]